MIDHCRLTITCVVFLVALKITLNVLLLLRFFNRKNYTLIYSFLALKLYTFLFSGYGSPTNISSNRIWNVFDWIFIDKLIVRTIKTYNFVPMNLRGIT